MYGYIYNNWDYWNLNQKVTFDGEKKLILISPGITELDVKIDLYSDWKEWFLLFDNSKYQQAFYSIGGEPLPGNRYVGPTYFLVNGWRIRTWEGSHTLTVNGNLYTEEGVSPYVPTLQSWTININSNTSVLVEGVLGLTPTQDAKLMSLPESTLTTEEHDHLLQLQNGSVVISPEDLQIIIDGVWEKVLPNGVSAQNYMIYKLLTTNKFIGLK